MQHFEMDPKISDYYELQQGLFLHSPSAAGELVQGHSCNEQIDWKNERGVSLEVLSGLSG